MKAREAEQKNLLRLQEVDTRLQQLAHQLKNLPQEATLSTLAKTLEEVRRRFAIATGEVDDARTELGRLESDVSVVEARIKRDSDRMQQSSSTKDLQALESELASLNKRRGDLEEIELTVMERVEEKEAALAAILAERDGVLDEVSVVEQERDRAAAELVVQQADAERDRSAVAKTVGEDLLDLYEKRRAIGGGIGAALLRARTCHGCNMTLTGADLEAVRQASWDDVLFCPECDRILIRTDESGIPLN
ncbi:MAG TPA: C4-type zinc ribbon domain-containing protein [Microterricola sp.]